MNDRISKQRELLAKKEGKFYSNNHDFQDRITSLPFEAGQNVWLQNSDSRKYEAAVIREKCREPNSYMVEIPATGQCFRRNSNFIKPRQSEENSNSTNPQPTTGLPEIPQEPPVLHPAVPSSQATSTVDAIPTVPQHCRIRILHPKLIEHQELQGHPPESPKEFHPQGLDYQNINSSFLCVHTPDIYISQREMLQYGSCRRCWRYCGYDKRL